ncbi:uncharacterized protein GLRG_04692 [Colletotrichum graminicola M1.001]|uniref:Uncharacterized protein n=1 Tax=Colletotrichum graminicola (strain M1.001 / M2 / FGSC 10212) TaxID=645133 RepID=E3QFB0_COLGM|nr:uncharacterized protein GLRG_04692 [Colletotrichum graminicola M1.001]EFQ29548.1 hypothetical protein GLRG_04692 [Colletotrichum graminicola M1.001]
MTKPVKNYVSKTRLFVILFYRFLQAFLETVQNRTFMEHVFEVWPKPTVIRALFVDCVPCQWSREIRQGDHS